MHCLYPWLFGLLLLFLLWRLFLVRVLLSLLSLCGAAAGGWPARRYAVLLPARVWVECVGAVVPAGSSRRGRGPARAGTGRVRARGRAVKRGPRDHVAERLFMHRWWRAAP